MPLYKPNPGLPDALYNLLTEDRKPRVAKYSVTELLAPPQQLQLRRRHADKIVIDPMDRVWTLFGQLVHGVLERAAGANSLTEEILTALIGGEIVSGMPDLLDPHAIVWDYKTTSVWKIVSGDFWEWECQLNFYVVLYHFHGFEVKAVRVAAVLRDWSKMKAKQDSSYPQKPITTLCLPLWRLDDAMQTMADRVLEHVDAESVSDKDLPPCTDSERWLRDRKWAVMKKGRKSAVKLYDSEIDADARAEALGTPHYVEFRPGKYNRCEGYCEAKPFCQQLIREKEAKLCATQAV